MSPSHTILELLTTPEQTHSLTFTYNIDVSPTCHAFSEQQNYETLMLFASYLSLKVSLEGLLTYLAGVCNLHLEA